MNGKSRVRRSPLAAYVVAVIAVAAALLARRLLDPLLADRLPFPTFFIAIVITAWYGGVRLAVAATLVSSFLSFYLFMPPRGQLTPKEVQDLIGLVLFVVVALTIVGFTGLLRRSQHVAESSEQLWQITLRSIGDAVITTDRESRVTFLNPAAVQLTRWSLDDAHGQPLSTVFRIVSEKTRETLTNPVESVLAGGEVVGLANHTILIARDGTERTIDDSAAPIRDEENNITGVVLVFRDVSERREAQRLMEESESRNAALVRAALDCIVEIDHEGRIVEFNPAAEQTFGHRRADVLGRKMADLIIPPSYRGRHAEGFARHLATGEARIMDKRLELSALRADGSEFPVELTVTRIAVDGPPIFAAFLRDITDRQEALRKLHGALAEMAEADRRKNEFLALLAHELRNPLAPLRNSVQVLRLGGDTKTVLAASDMMERQLGHMVRLVDDLLDVSRISRGKIQLRPERTELATAVHHAVEATHELAQCMSHKIVVTMPPEPVYVHADPTRLAQVIGNLLNNACKFTDRGGHISLSVERADGQAVIRLRDNGIGISADQLTRIFDPFVQVDTAVDRSVGGLGIGLSLVKNIVEMHGGTVGVRSAGLGHGAEFVVTLPLLSAVDAALSPDSVAGAPPRASGHRVLIVDDNRDSADSLATLLALKGNETRVAYSGAEAMAAAESFRPDAMLLDIGLPHMDGYQVARRIRSEPWGKELLLVAITGWGQDEDRVRSREAGFDAHLVKPVELGELSKLFKMMRHGA